MKPFLLFLLAFAVHAQTPAATNPAAAKVPSQTDLRKALQEAYKRMAATNPAALRSKLRINASWRFHLGEVPPLCQMLFETPTV